MLFRRARFSMLAQPAVLTLNCYEINPRVRILHILISTPVAFHPSGRPVFVFVD